MTSPVEELGAGRPAAHWQECAKCGSLVANPLLHQAWHLNYMRCPGGKIVARGRSDGRAEAGSFPIADVMQSPATHPSPC
jgi:DNA-directed RNA polymerase subunit RPC12/RpoP